jgi:hypothetical protein
MKTQMQQRRSHSATGLLFFVGIVAGAFGDTFDVGGEKQLFIDSRFIAESENLALVMNPAQKLGPIFDERGQRIHGHVSGAWTVGEKVRLYVGADDLILYESDDGTRFTRTAVTIPHGIFPTVFIDEHDPEPTRRYKLFWIQCGATFDPAIDGVYAGFSADGVNFTEAGRVLPFYTDNPSLVYWDGRIGKYIIYTRALALNVENQRRIARIETDDPLKPWPYTATDHDAMFSGPDNLRVVLAADAKDNPHSDIYYSAAIPYPWAQDAYFMFTSQFRHFSPDRNPYIRPREEGRWEDFGLLEAQIAVSRDGIVWQRSSREQYVPGGLADEWDRWYVVMGPGMGRRGNYIYQYYAATGRTHDSVVVRPEYDEVPGELGGIGAVRQRLDGFISADVDHRGGWFVTPLLLFKGSRLRLNIDTGAMGTALVELRDADGQPIPGYTLQDCEEIVGNFIDQAVYWKGKTDVSALAGTPVSMHIELSRTKLYAFQFSPE